MSEEKKTTFEAAGAEEEASLLRELLRMMKNSKKVPAYAAGAVSVAIRHPGHSRFERSGAIYLQHLLTGRGGDGIRCDR